MLEILGRDPALAAKRLAGAKGALSQLPLVALTLAIEPTPAKIQAIWEKVCGFLDQPCVLALTVDAWLIGGGTVTYQGRYGDYSLKSKLEKM